MPRYGTQIQKDARDLFDNYKEDIEKLNLHKFEIILDENNVKKIKGCEVVERLEEIKEILEEMMGEWYEYVDESDDGNIYRYMIFDMDEYHINDGSGCGYRWWILEFEIDEYRELVEKKLSEYNILEK